MKELTKFDVIWDMETGDPDDYLTLLWLLGHPRVNLLAVTVTPGSTLQIGLVRRTLDQFESEARLGAFNIEHPKSCVSAWHEKVYGRIAASDEAESGPELLAELCNERSILITGGPLKNLGGALKFDHFSLGLWVAQGGFAGAGVVPEALQLPKFRGLKACPTYNFNGDPKSAERALVDPRIQSRRLISKNVCHRVFYDQSMHDFVGNHINDHTALREIHRGMQSYLQKRPQGKKFHDPLAAACALDPSIAEWRTVRMFREKGRWGAELCESSSTQIIVDYDESKFRSGFVYRG